jgi:hypothetical protein
VVHKPNRIVSVDFWRGVALAMIFIDHVPGNFFDRFTQRNFGFSDAAEVFVFLAGAAAAFAYLRHFDRAGATAQTLRIGQRALQLYMAHVVVLILCGGILAYASLATQDPRIMESMQFDQLANQPLQALVGIATLGLQPSYLNILPLYVVLLLMSPVLIVLTRLDMRLALGLSGALYLATQFFGLALPSYPSPDAWYLNPFAWQLLFTLGLCCGRGISERRAVPTSRALVVLALLYLALSFVLVSGDFVGSYDLSPLPRFLWDQDKTNLSLPRLLHIGALIYLVSRLPIDRWITDKAACRPLILMGRHSLPVFSLGVVLSMTAQVLRIVYDGQTAYDFLVIPLGFGLQMALAFVLTWQQSAKEAENGAPGRAGAPAA